MKVEKGVDMVTKRVAMVTKRFAMVNNTEYRIRIILLYFVSKVNPLCVVSYSHVVRW